MFAALTQTALTSTANTACVFLGQIDLHGMNVEAALVTLESTLSNFCKLSTPGHIVIEVRDPSCILSLAA